MATLPSELNAGRTDTFLLDPENITLVTDPENPLYDPRVHDAPDDALVRNIMVYGIVNPVTIRKNGNAVEVVAGRGRVKAALEANRRLTAEGKQPLRVPAVLKRGPDAEMYGVLISENECRRNDGPLVKADKALRLINMGKTKDEVAVAFGVTRQAVESWLALQDVADPVRQAVEAGELSATAAMQLAPLGRDEQIKTLETVKAEGGKVTAARAKRAARKEDAAPMPKMRTRKAVEDCLYQETGALHSIKDAGPQDNVCPKGACYQSTAYNKGFCTALRWVLGLEDISSEQATEPD